MEVKRFAQGEIIFREWTPGQEMYEIRSGRVGIYVRYGSGEEKKLTELEPGRIFGELSALDGQPRSATAVALCDTEAAAIGADDLREYFTGNPGRLLEIMHGISRRLRELTDDYTDVCAAIREMEQAAEHGKEKSAGLMGKIRRFMADYAAAQKTLAELGIHTFVGLHGSYYI